MRSITASLVVAAGLASGLVATPAAAQDVPVERYSVGTSEVTLYTHAFLTETDVETLRILAQSTDALALFLPAADSFGAIAVAPGEGFLIDGIPAESVVAISDLPSAEAADQAAREACDGLRADPEPCVIALSVAPE